MEREQGNINSLKMEKCLLYNKMNGIKLEQSFKIFKCLGFPSGSVVKESACQCRSYKFKGSIPGSGRFLWRRKWHPLQYLVRKTSWTEEPVRQQPMDLQRVRHNCQL